MNFRERVVVMHASAALDAVEYEKKGEVWRTSDVFQWELRDRPYNSETAGKMESYYRKYGWVSNNVNIGDGKTIEFKCDLRRWGKSRLSVAIVMADYSMNLHHVPPGLEDHTLSPRLIQGYTSDSLSFRPDSWLFVRE
ncbi:MAG TPA: hypothetical protein VGA55_05585 [Bacteroidota bacterium]